MDSNMFKKKASQSNGEYNADECQSGVCGFIRRGGRKSEGSLGVSLI